MDTNSTLKFLDDLNNEKRNLIGKEQLRFIAKETKKKFFWNVFGQQVLVQRTQENIFLLSYFVVSLILLKV